MEKIETFKHYQLPVRNRQAKVSKEVSLLYMMYSIFWVKNYDSHITSAVLSSVSSLG